LKKKETGKAYRRIKADELIPTITTDVNMQDARNGASVHWSQHRPLSIQDARRTQGYPDSEPIIGTIKEQWKILGNGVDRKVSFAIGLALRDALVKSKHIPELNELLEDEAELVVDAEEEDINERLSEGIESATVDLTGEPSQSSSESSSTDTISTTRETRERFDLSLSMDDVQDARTMSQGPHLTSLQQINEVEKPPVPTKGFFSPLSRIVIANVERLSLPTFPTFILSAQSSLPAKRQIDKDGPEERGILNPVTGRISPYKRAKFVEVRRTTSPVSGKLKNEAKTAARRASLPPPQRNTHTRRSGPAEFCPRYWHGKIGTSNNVVKLS
jgi:DNA (cytosine-5)-methyltransferase 1